MIKLAVFLPNPERLARAESTGVFLSQSATQMSGVCVVIIVLVFLEAKGFVFQNSPQGTPGIFKKERRSAGVSPLRWLWRRVFGIPHGCLVPR